MKPSGCLLPAVAIALWTAPLSAATFDENALVQEIARGITTSDTAVACQLRTPDWRNSVFLGYIATARIAVMSELKNASDNKITARAVNIFKAAKMRAALQAEFAAPTQAECDILNASHDMQETDAAAKIGLMFGAVNQ